MLLKIIIIISSLLFANGFILHRIIRSKTKIKSGEYIEKPPAAEAIIRLQKEGYSYLRCLSALVIEKNNETSALMYLKLSPDVKDYVKDKY